MLSCSIRVTSHFIIRNGQIAMLFAVSKTIVGTNSFIQQILLDTHCLSNCYPSPGEI